MSTLNNLYGGDGTQYNLPSGDANTIEPVSLTDNIFNPEMLYMCGWYYSWTDGKTKNNTSRVKFTPEKIHIYETEKLYVRAQTAYEVTDYVSIIFYFYDEDDSYLGYTQYFLTAENQNKNFNVPSGTRYICIYCGSTSMSSNNLCISYSELTEFKAFSGIDKLKYRYLPYIYNEAFDFNTMYGKQIVIFGDSIVNSSTLCNAIAEYTGATVYQCTVSGSSARLRGFSGWDEISMNRLAYAIANDDYTETEQGSSSLAAKLEAIDFSKIDTVILGFGYNDGANNLDNTANKLDCSTYCGALRYTIQTLLSAFPQLKIYPMSQVCHYSTSLAGDLAQDATISAANKTVCEEYHLKVIDNLNIGMNKSNYSYYYTNGDYTHPNSYGIELMARNIARSLI